MLSGSAIDVTKVGPRSTDWLVLNVRRNVEPLIRGLLSSRWKACRGGDSACPSPNRIRARSEPVGRNQVRVEAVEIARREAPGIAKLLRACTCRSHAQPYCGYPAAGVVSTSPRRRATGLDQQSDAAYMVRTEFNPRAATTTGNGR
jgi:hypothetical protein